MDRFIAQFQHAYLLGSGPQLAQTLVLAPPQDDPAYLERISRFSNKLAIAQDIRNKILSTGSTQAPISKAEATAWADVYAAYWKTANEVVQTRGSQHRTSTSIYEAWKEVVNALIKGYSQGHFQSWTIPCLYTAGRSLRVFAIRADEANRGRSGLNFNAGSKEDIGGDLSKNGTLEDAARQINRVFTTCISDRLAMSGQAFRPKLNSVQISDRIIS